MKRYMNRCANNSVTTASVCDQAPPQVIQNTILTEDNTKTFVHRKLRFTVGDTVVLGLSGPVSYAVPLQQGQSLFIINEPGINQDSINVVVNNQSLHEDRSNELSYTTAYGLNASSFLLNQVATTGQQFAVSYTRTIGTTTVPAPTVTTPAPPGLVADDVANTLYATHALGTSEIVMSVNNGAFEPYAPVTVGDVARAAGYWKFKIKSAAGRNESSVVNSPAFTVAVASNTTPAAPTVTGDDTANTLTATHALGAGEILVSENGGAFVAYAPITVGNVARASGYWQFKIKAATGRNESALAASPAFTVAIATFTARWGWKVAAGPLTQAEIETAPLNASFTSGANVVADFTSNPDFRYLWMAEPVGQPAKTKSSTALGDEAIGGTGTFATPTVVSGVWRFYITQAQTTLSGGQPTTFKVI